MEVFYEAPDPTPFFGDADGTNKTTLFFYETRRKRRKEAVVATKRKESLDFWGSVTIVMDLRDFDR